MLINVEDGSNFYLNSQDGGLTFFGLKNNTATYINTTAGHTVDISNYDYLVIHVYQASGNYSSITFTVT